MCLNDFFYNGKSETGSFFIFSAGQVRFIETVEYLLHTVLRNSDARILYRNKDLFVFYAGLDVNRGILMAKLNGIID